MFDMRYHIVSLVAVFLALAIGILLGTVIVDKGILVEQQKALVEKLESDFQQLRNQNAQLTQELRQSELYIEQSFYPLVKDKLAGQQVAVIFTSPIDNGTKRAILESFRWAGATYSCVTLNLPFDLKSEAFEKQILPGLEGVQGSDIGERLLNKLADGLAAVPVDNKIDNKFLQDLAAAGLISVDAFPTAQTTSVLIVGGSDRDNSTKVDVALINKFKALKLRTVGSETSSRKISYMQHYQRAGIATVDNIENQIGRASAILSLSSGVIGNFGVKPTANQLIPAITPE